LRNNPRHYELLYELGVIYNDEYHDPDRARNLWLGALSRWRDQDVKARVASAEVYGKVTANLGRLEDSAGNWKLAIHYLEMAKEISPQPGALQKQIDDIRV